MNRLVFVAGLVLLVFLASFSLAEIPRLINYQGMLTDDEGNPLNTPQDLTFRIYNVESGGTLLWGETQNNVPLTNGLFNVALGAVTPIDLPFDEDYWVEIEVGVLGALSPRVKLTSVGYAYRAETADTAIYAIQAVSAETDSDWTISGNNIYSAVSGNVGIGTTAPDVKLHIKGEGYYPYVKTEVTDETGAGVQLRATGVLTEPGGTNQWGLFIRASDNSGDLYLNEDYVGGAWSPTTRFVIENETGNVGIGTTDPSTKLDVEGDVNVNSVYRIGGKRVLDASGTRKICVGNGAGAASNGLNSTFVGDSAGYSSQGLSNTFVGTWAGYSNGYGDFDTFLGYKAGYANSTGGANTFLGCNAGRLNTTGESNTFVGSDAGYLNKTSSQNTFVGKSAGYYSDGGDSNTFIGNGAGYHNHTGSYNTSLGRLAGYLNETGSGNVFIGHSAGYYEKGSNKLFIANTRDSSDVLVYGDFSTRRIGIGNLAPEGMLHIENSGSGAEAFLWIETSHSTNWHEAGIRIKTPQNKWHLRMDDDTNNQIPDGALGLRSQDSGVETMTWAEDGNVGIKKTNPAYTLDVNGDINVSGNIRKGGTAYTHPDYVFEPDYELMSLEDLKEYVSEKKCLPKVISAEDVKKNNGYNMDELLIQMLEKIEEQTLYIFQLEERIAALESRE